MFWKAISPNVCHTCSHAHTHTHTLTHTTFSILAAMGLIVIALGTGGIKPCVSALGGDQFEEGQVREVLTYHHSKILVGHVMLTIL